MPDCELSPHGLHGVRPDAAGADADLHPGRRLGDGLDDRARTQRAADLDGAVQADGNEVVAQVEAQPEAFADPAVGWAALGPEAVLAREPGAGAVATHTGSVTLPDPPPGQRLRVAVREYELHPADDRTTAPVRMVSTRRLVHVDTVDL